MPVRRLIPRVLSALAAVCLGCEGGASPSFLDTGTPGSDDVASTDSATEPLPESDSDFGTETEEAENPRTAGQACWKEIFGHWHPNYGLPDCEKGLTCIGNSDEAWCSERCEETGAINDKTQGLEGWCCGELADPCDPQRFWLPTSMNAYCIPRTAGLGEPCHISKEWTGTQVRCEPVCRSGTTIHTQCVSSGADELFCSIQCDPLNMDADCLIEPAFSDGCCREMMGGHWCLPAGACR